MRTIAKRSVEPRNKTAVARERLRKRYRPDRVSILFVGEAPPASGRFFYQADSGLYRAIRDAFTHTFPATRKGDFLESFQASGCYLVDLCGKPVDRLSKGARGRACLKGEAGLSRKLQQLRPDLVVTVLRSIAPNVKRSQERAKWPGHHIVLPYPGRWHRHRTEFLRRLVPVLRKHCSRN